MSDGITESKRMVNELVIAELSKFSMTNKTSLINIMSAFLSVSCPKDMKTFIAFLNALSDIDDGRSKWTYENFWDRVDLW